MKKSFSDIEFIYYDIQTTYNQSYESMESMGLYGLFKMNEMKLIKETIEREVNENPPKQPK
jgi:hypothetical protein